MPNVHLLFVHTKFYNGNHADYRILHPPSFFSCGDIVISLGFAGMCGKQVIPVVEKEV